MTKEIIVNFLNLLSNVFLILIIIRVVLSFMPNAIGRFRLFIYNVTEPVLAPVRKIIPPIGGALDLSPIIVFLLIQLLAGLVNRFL